MLGSGVRCACLLLMAVGCATSSGLGAPELDIARLYRPKLDLAPPEVRLSVTDLRAPLPQSSREAVADVRAALTRLLTAQELRVHAAASHRLGVALGFVEQAPRGFERDDCISIGLKLELAQPLGMVYATGFACYATRNGFGMGMGGDPTVAYEQALNTALQQLELHRRRLPSTRGAEDRAARLSAAAFAADGRSSQAEHESPDACSAAAAISCAVVPPSSRLRWTPRGLRIGRWACREHRDARPVRGPARL